MRKFKFSQSEVCPLPPVFSGDEFYDKYKSAEFLRHSDQIETILWKGYELRRTLRGVAPGEAVIIDGVWLERETLPLFVRRTGPNYVVQNFEFTANRLTGFVAAHVFDNRQRYPTMRASEPLALGLTWDNTDEFKCRLYLSAVSGTEHFSTLFHFWPLVCALRKLQLKKITLEPVVKMAKIKNSSGVPMGKTLMKNKSAIKTMWLNFSGTTNWDFDFLFVNLPQELKNIMNAK